MILFYAGDGVIQLLGARIGIIIASVIGLLSFPITTVLAIVMFCLVIAWVGRYSRKK